MGGKLDFPVFLRSERRKTGKVAALPPLSSAVNWILQFSSALRGGNLAGCSFTTAIVGGKVDFPVFLRSERMKTGNCIYATGTYGGNLSVRFLIPYFVPSFARWWVTGPGLVPQNEGWTLVNNNWVK
ncbi:hypothetical protein AAC387_Pa12g1470 [Persea americana]